MMGFDLILLLIVGANVYATGGRPRFNQKKPTQRDQTPLEILQARYARGEISRKECDQMRLDLVGRERKAVAWGKKIHSAGGVSQEVTRCAAC